MFIAVDHGNKQIKTANHVFISGLQQSETRPPFGENILQYENKFYFPSDQRMPYMRDKTVDQRFYILTLMAIANEIEAAKRYSQGDVVDVQLLVGLPPAHFGALYKKFEEYFLRDRDVVDFVFKDKPYQIYISEVVAFPQAYAAAMTLFNDIKAHSKVTVVDIGGFTADYLQIKSGHADLSVCDSMEHGVIMLYNSIRSKVNSAFDVPLDEVSIDDILKGSPHGFDIAVHKMVSTMAQGFIVDYFGELRERMIDLRFGQSIFVGGGSILLRKQIVECGKVGNALFVDDIAANVKGYELLYKVAKAKR